ncbi:hypothetical protein L2755_04105 [Shewanella abyssi]|uniref:hypothetical protein n=1 Tax=Shewanella abyssi TaxID=311789 RepID=UPI0020105938|nr:hypothetical protein [Shewanella abyssi]MCL1048814.1 hypothetical protein [Shewanella abyssi]
MNKLLILLLTLTLTSCSSDDDEQKQAINIFPSVLEGQKCIKNMDPNDTQYHKVIIEFDSGGYQGIGWAIYDDSECVILASRHHDVNSYYPNRLGNQVINLDGTIGNELFFPDPENAGLYGTVYHINEELLCFAKGTVNLNTGYTNRPNLSSIHFGPTSVEGDFSNLEIDRDNCFKVK